MAPSFMSTPNELLDISQSRIKSALGYFALSLAMPSILMSHCESSRTAIQHVGEHYYYISSVSKAALIGKDNQLSGPCTVLPVFDSLATQDDLTRIIAAFEYQDDVWTRSFLQTVIVRGASSEDGLSTEIEDLLKSWGTQHIRYWYHNSADTRTSQGPYWLQNGNFHRVSRLYPDNSDAFVVSVVQDDEDEHIYRPLGVSAHGESNPASLSVAVPSRLYFKRNDSHPLAGMRIAVKDNTDLSGIRTGGSSHGYTRLYGPRQASAPIIQKLLDLGAIAVGKTKTTQFADTEWATGDWIDFHPPFTPRADGYQSPSGSSAGSGAAVAAYDWLDFATGTDGCGSLRSPAAIEGLFTMRPSHGSTSVEGIIPWGSTFDTFGVFARDVDTCASLSRFLYGAPGVQPSGRLPRRIICPLDYWPVQHAESQASFHSFISKLEAYLGVKCTAIRLTDLWENTNPVGTNESLASYFHNTLPWIYAPTQWQTYKTFQQDYWNISGKTPYFNPEGQFKMDWLPTVTSEMHKNGLKKLPSSRLGSRRTLSALRKTEPLKPYYSCHGQQVNLTIATFIDHSQNGPATDGNTI